MCDARVIVLKTYLRELERQAAPTRRPVRRGRTPPEVGLFAALFRAAAWPLWRWRPAPVDVSRR